MDLDRVTEREQFLRSKRFLHLFLQPDGMTRLTGLLDPESAAIVTATFDAVTSPRRGGPRFVDPTLAARAEQIATDERTTEQLVLDAFVELIRIGTAADTTVVLGAKRPGIKLLVTDKDLRQRRGVGFIEGHTEPVSIATIERHTCTTGVIPIKFDTEGEILNLGREHRLFSSRQGIGIAARDGGCQLGDCDRPPSWCETHHIDHWVRDHGTTNTDRGILLCRHHHMHVMADPDAILEWIRATSLRPFLDALAGADARAAFEAQLRGRIDAAFPVRADGKRLFPFMRLFFVAYR